jgi:hypothetical protein
MEKLAFKKPRQHFDTATHPSRVTFDDGKIERSFPWISCGEVVRENSDPNIIRVEIGEWIVVLHGYNLTPLFTALEEQTLLRVRAAPDLANNAERESDSFVTGIRFLRPVPAGSQSKRKGTPQMELGIG